MTFSDRQDKAGKPAMQRLLLPSAQRRPLWSHDLKHFYSTTKNHFFLQNYDKFAN
jgi:hypothetical protein